MKKIVKLMTLLMLFVISNMTFAARVSEQSAKSVAANFCHIDSSNMVLNYTSTNSTTVLFYVFGYKDGFVLVAADDRVQPILGYSTEGRPFIPPKENDTTFGNNFLGLMNTYNKVIKYVIDNDLPGTVDITYKWSTYKTGGYVPQSPTMIVTPLLTTTWGQGWPYNSLCPVDPLGSGGRVWAGCVSVAMAQILKFLCSPISPTVGLGNFSYQSGSYPVTSANFNTNYYWSLMPNSTSTVDTNISKAIYHQAVGVMSQWGNSNTNVIYSSGEDPMTRELKNYYKMSSTNLSYITKADYTTIQWDSILQSELSSGRPMVYDGDGNISHTFDCDGVDNSGLYHFNFGWEGSYDGYYSLGNINPGGNNLTNNQHAIIGIKLNDGSTLTTNTTWTGSMTFYTNICVPDSITLTINAGANIKFAPGCGLYIFGRIICNGTSTNPIILTALNTTAGWNGVRFDNNYNARLVMAGNNPSIFNYTNVSYSMSSGITCVAYGKVTLNHCRIHHNHGIWGAGVSVWYVPINMYYCELDSNNASSLGGGIAITTTDTLSSLMHHNNIHNNTANSGGGFYLFNVNNITLESNTVSYNQAGDGAAGTLMYGTPTLTNNTFCNNNASSTGGALLLENCNANIINNLIANNSSSAAGGGIQCQQNSAPNLVTNDILYNTSPAGAGINLVSNCNANIKDCIIFGNYATNFGSQIALGTTDCDPFFDHCDIQGGLAGFGGPGSGSNYTTGNYTNNIDSNPLFVSPSGGTGSGYNGLTANWQLLSTSPCINAGDTTGISNLLPAVDLAGNPRITNTTIDMGAYEYLCVAVPVSVTIVANQNPVCPNTT
ncbi:MAG: C10 family peptidase, partial [bacterium]